MEDAAGAQLVFVDGIFVPELSDTSSAATVVIFHGRRHHRRRLHRHRCCCCCFRHRRRCHAFFSRCPISAASGCAWGPIPNANCFSGRGGVKSQLGYYPKFPGGGVPREADEHGPPVRLPSQLRKVSRMHAPAKGVAALRPSTKHVFRMQR